MPKHLAPLSVLCLALAVSPACLVRRRAVVTPPSRRAGPLLVATKDDLIQRIHAFQDPIQSFLLRADLTPTVLDRSKAVETDYATIGVDILFRRPEDIRILGLQPLIESTIVDMVSNGKEFRVSIPRKKRFIIGDNDAPETSEHTLENLRPAAIQTSLLIYPPEPKAELAVLENDTDRALYILLIVRRKQDQLTPARGIYFDQHTLQITRQKTFDSSGAIVSDARYSNWKDYGGISYPSDIEIQRPEENYKMQLNIVSAKFNQPGVTADKFVLEQPSGTELKIVK